MGIEAAGGISILDDSLGIDWRIPAEYANLSEKDKIHGKYSVNAVLCA